MSDAEESNLRTLYARALALARQLDELAATTTEFRRVLAQSADAFRQCRRLSASLALFSPNETVDDISTGDLQYLNIDFHLAELVGRAPVSGPEARKAALHEAQEAYAGFLGRLESYELLTTQDKKLFERWHADRDRFELVAAADPATRRGAKIQRYQEEKALKQKLEYLEAQSESTTGDEDSTHRDLYRAQLGFNTFKAFQALDYMVQELQILSMAPTDVPTHTLPTPDTDPRLRQAGDGAYSERLDQPLQTLLNGNRGGPILNGQGKPLQPFVLHDNRSKLREGVFRPGHRLPTMSIEEYLDAEKARGGIIEGGGEQSGIPREVDEDDLDAADRETEKQRSWDKFKEANPKGSGNTINRG